MKMLIENNAQDKEAMAMFIDTETVGVFDMAKFRKFTEFLKETYPDVYAEIKENYNFDIIPMQCKLAGDDIVVDGQGE